MSNTSDAIDDAVAYSKDLPQFVGTFASNTFLADAMGYSALHPDVRAAIWDSFEASWALGYAEAASRPASLPTDPFLMNDQGAWNAATNSPTLVSSVGTEGDMYTVSASGTLDPDLDGKADWNLNNRAMFYDGAWHKQVSLNTYMPLTRTEAIDVYAARVSHVFMLDILRLVPWQISSYNLEECEGLLKPSNLFYSWDSEAPIPAEYEYIACYDPKTDYDFILSQLGPVASTHEQQFELLAAQTYRTLTGVAPIVHFGAGGNWNTVTLPEFWAPGTSNVDGNNQSGSQLTRAGCVSTSPLFTLYMQLMNIPARVERGYFAGLAFHRSIVFPTLWVPQRDTSPYTYTPVRGGVFAHGDNPYDFNMRSALGLRKLEPMGYWNEHIFPLDLGTESSVAAYHTWRLWWMIQMEQVRGLSWRLPNAGWAAIAAEMAPYFDQPEDVARLDKFHSDLITRNDGIDYP